MKTIPLLWLLALVSGALIPVQAAANAALSRSIHGNIPFAAGTLFLVADLRGAPWWSYTGGVIVAFYVFTITFLAPRLGVGTAIALIVTGQVLGALTIDHFGLLRSLTVPLNPARLGGATLIVIGVYLALRR